MRYLIWTFNEKVKTRAKGSDGMQPETCHRNGVNKAEFRHDGIKMMDLLLPSLIRLYLTWKDQRHQIIGLIDRNERQRREADDGVYTHSNGFTFYILAHLSVLDSVFPTHPSVNPSFKLTVKCHSCYPSCFFKDTVSLFYVSTTATHLCDAAGWCDTDECDAWVIH